MALYLIAYELKRLGHNYQPLYATLRDWRARRTLESTWLLKSDRNVVEMRDALLRLIDQDDRLLVAEIIESTWTAYNVMIDLKRDLI